MKMRRTAAALAALALFPLAACGSDSDETTGDGWTYTDDLGTEIALDRAPERIVAQTSMAAALNDLGVDGIVGVFGPLTLADGSVDPQAAGLDPDELDDVTGGGEYGDLDVEKIGTLSPDLLITSTYVEPTLWYINEASAEDLGDTFPLLVQSFENKTLTQILDGTEELAEALGADLSAEVVADAHEEFEAAAERLRAIGEQLGDRTILAASPSADLLYVSNPDVSPDLKYYRDELGLPIVTPDNPDPQGGYFESLSWENADKYAGDIILYDDRVGVEGLALFEPQAVWQTLTGARNKAYVPWVSVVPSSYKAQAAVMNDLADDLEQYL